MKRILIVIFLLIIVGIFFSQECNKTGGWPPRTDKYCKCQGILVPVMRKAEVDGYDIDRCIGTVTNLQNVEIKR